MNAARDTNEEVDKFVKEYADSTRDDPVLSSVLYAPLPTNKVNRMLHQVPIMPQQPNNNNNNNNGRNKECKSFHVDFSKDVRGWQVEHINMPYNVIGGRGPTLNATDYIRFGKISATVRSAGAGGSVTAFILLADGGDEIDFEFLGGDVRTVQTNYFWGPSKEFTVNGGFHTVAGGDVDKEFHKYTIDWKPDSIEWLVDDKLIRTKMRKDTCDSAGLCKFPSEPARIQFGLWDGSIEPGTAEWSRGPIDWSEPHNVTAYLRDVKVECY
ncbi:concanavalin A-like lectin/glucanase domain-containing protein [Mycotypha africana]|uniref:concanavalin A-like lectin/glucanase domain-containing protein n=1 Tax=Mycotypha africana TaxID=64632 RepID=UPI0023001FAA|nr:concanavalin A-like lectin/glucanase domain-containing protein [Mycotypha africana]KAI8967873.1 concanavalin A-like lectin/glucanase domain-containing protein [Mycotypha africana]